MVTQTRLKPEARHTVVSHRDVDYKPTGIANEKPKIKAMVTVVRDYNKVHGKKPYTGPVKVTLHKWKTCKCSPRRTEVSMADKTGYATETCKGCGEVRIVPSCYWLIIDGLKSKTLKALKRTCNTPADRTYARGLSGLKLERI
jgi:hypothetical protein